MPIKFPICYERSKSGESAVLIGADLELVGELWSITDEELEALVSMANKGASYSTQTPRTCPECGSDRLTWHTAKKVVNEVPQGKLNTNDVECIFYLGCDECSETLVTLSAETVAASLTDLGVHP